MRLELRIARRGNKDFQFSVLLRRFGKLAALVVGNRLFDFLERVHHERSVLHHRFAQRPRGQQNEARARIAGRDFDRVAIRQHARCLRAQRARSVGRTVGRP